VKTNFDLSSVFEYIKGTTKIDGVLTSDGITDDGLNLGALSANQKKTITFSAKVLSNYEYDLGSNYFQSTAYATATGLSKQIETIEINVVRSAVGGVSLVLGGRNLSNGQAFASNYVSAYPDQSLEFTIKVVNTGDVDASHVVVKSILSPQLKYVSDSTEVDSNSFEDGITATGLDIGTIDAGDYSVISFRADIVSNSSFGYGKTTLANKISIATNNVGSASQALYIYVTKMRPEEAKAPDREVLVYNETKNQDATMVSAQPGDVISVYLMSKNNNSIIVSDYEVKNDISEVLPVASVIYNGGGVVNNSEIVYSKSNIAANEVISKEFKVKVNEAETWGEGGQIIVDYGNTAIVNLEEPIIIPEPKLEIKKTISNLTWDNGDEVEINARANDQIQMQVEVVNTSSVMVGDVKVMESLPDKMNYVSSSDNGEYNSLTGETMWNLGALLPNEKKSLNLLASVASDVFVPSNFTSEARAEASTGVKNLTISSNSVTANIKGFVNPYTKWIKPLIIFGGLIIIGIVILLLIIKGKHKKNGSDSGEYAVI
jgi:uncharacterized repeat protein (TIGR01451 family)